MFHTVKVFELRHVCVQVWHRCHFVIFMVPYFAIVWKAVQKIDVTDINVIKEIK